MKDYLDINRKSWDAKVAHHVKSDFYFVDEFLKGRTSLNTPELELLGDISGKKILHLQCHFGQDSISLSRMGAQVTGVDFSETAIRTATEMAGRCGTDTRFVVSDVYGLPEVLDEQFDIVFTSYGVIGWLPDLDRWAGVISHFLKPGGRLVFVEFHPVVWMFDDDFTHVKYSYFNTGAISETYEGTYADQSAALVQDYIMWNHSLADVLGNLMKNGLQISAFQELNWSPYPCFRHTEEVEKGKYRIPQFGDKIPVVYTVMAVKM